MEEREGGRESVPNVVAPGREPAAGEEVVQPGVEGEEKGRSSSSSRRRRGGRGGGRGGGGGDGKGGRRTA